MNVIFIHQNMPGQFWRLATHLASMPDFEVSFITRRTDRTLPGVRRLNYELSRPPSGQIHPYLRQMEEAVLHGQAVARCCLELSRQEAAPDLIIGHPGWGEMLYVKDVFPDAKTISYAEFFDRRPNRAFENLMLNARAGIRTAMAHIHLSLSCSDHAWSPLEWQKSTFPSEYASKIEVIYDGVDATVLAPNPMAKLGLTSGPNLDRTQEIITFIARGLEPVRGFDRLAAALPDILARRPHARILIIGEDKSYYAQQPQGGSWIERLLPDNVKSSDRIIFAGRLSYPDYIRALQISSLHLYLSEPFVLSWSFMEALSIGALVLALDTPPVREVLSDGQNGVLWDGTDLAGAIDAALGRSDIADIRASARKTVLSKYSIEQCLPLHLESMQRLVR